jgi:hypothetical protein
MIVGNCFLHRAEVLRLNQRHATRIQTHFLRG